MGFLAKVHLLNGTNAYWALATAILAVSLVFVGFLWSVYAESCEREIRESKVRFAAIEAKVESLRKDVDTIPTDVIGESLRLDDLKRKTDAELLATRSAVIGLRDARERILRHLDVIYKSLASLDGRMDAAESAIAEGREAADRLGDECHQVSRTATEAVASLNAVAGTFRVMGLRLKRPPEDDVDE